MPRVVRTLVERRRGQGTGDYFVARTDERGGAITLAIATHFGIPVSTTHTITGAIVGVGATKRLSAVKWGVAGRIVWAWVLTIPMAGLIAALSYVVIVGIDKVVGK